MIFETHDKVVSEEEQLSIFKYCVQAEYSWGEIDKQGSPETGLIHEIPSDVPIHELLKERALDAAPSVLEGLSLYRMYINLFAPSEKPYFHSDGPEGQITILYYPHLEWDLDDGGETLFLLIIHFTVSHQCQIEWYFLMHQYYIALQHLEVNIDLV